MGDNSHLQTYFNQGVEEVKAHYRIFAELSQKSEEFKRKADESVRNSVFVKSKDVVSRERESRAASSLRVLVQI